MSIRSAINAVKSQALGVAESLTPILKESKFRESGVLTPEEFVAAGDHLVHQCPTWAWATGEISKVKSFLPQEKQYLVTRNVPCYKRCRHMEPTEGLEKLLDDDWVDTHHFSPDSQSEAVQLSGTGSELAEVTVAGGSDTTAVATTAEDDEEEAVDLEEFVEGGAYLEDEDPNVVSATGSKGDQASESGLEGGEGKENGTGEHTSSGADIITTRTYDLMITYDRYYQTPRLWLYGYDEKRNNLNKAQMFEDISAEHAQQTVTMESHPHLNSPSMASVHPCRHADVMKKILQTVQEGGGEIGVHMYLVVFLKFVQAVIPTIEYDYTRNFNMASLGASNSSAGQSTSAATS
ncbi:ubiquitin-like-conjugating enzyme ATG3 [Convolutriloba macropyga]|uniref:ubiquitin-like-conjugating enzyme ATG3 n=1 Tax=Convolutriloba macropyga TaxID=536237 RepID=UPI003F529037